jgi:hypothetical protein
MVAEVAVMIVDEIPAAAPAKGAAKIAKGIKGAAIAALCAQFTLLRPSVILLLSMLAT